MAKSQPGGPSNAAASLTAAPMDSMVLLFRPRQFQLLASMFGRDNAPCLTYIDHYGPWGIEIEGIVLLDYLDRWPIGKRKRDSIRAFTSAAAAAGKRIYIDRGGDSRHNNGMASISILNKVSEWKPVRPPAGTRPIFIVLEESKRNIDLDYVPELRWRGWVSRPRAIFSHSYTYGQPDRLDWRNGPPDPFPREFPVPDMLPNGDLPWPSDEEIEAKRIEALFQSPAGRSWLTITAGAARRAGAIFLGDHSLEGYDVRELISRLTGQLAAHAPVFPLPPAFLRDNPTEAWRDTWDNAMRDLRSKLSSASPKP